MTKTAAVVLPPQLDNLLEARAHWGVPTRQIGVRVAPGIWQTLEEAAAHHQVRVSDVVRAAITDWMVTNGFIQRGAQ